MGKADTTADKGTPPKTDEKTAKDGESDYSEYEESGEEESAAADSYESSADGDADAKKESEKQARPASTASKKPDAASQVESDPRRNQAGVLEMSKRQDSKKPGEEKKDEGKKVS